ncbi:hypothetical protein H2200_012235 [Cladophialophora chaetospira]|uniref:Uncharacterized protein n=1 Tax=Cladophialophora chaetospira TaxID=386627 RepID=A0AA39CCP7_9EURO|nr:hypothetical protein H2200_012235 [Cladophialophora chaetospira]
MDLEFNPETIRSNMNRYLGYKLLLGADQANDVERSFRQEKMGRRSEKLKIFSMLGGIVVALAVVSLGLRFIIAESSPEQQAPFLKHCGTTAAEARSNNCTFDTISLAWTPPACYDVELSKEFFSVRKWEWFADVNLTKSVSKSELETGRLKTVYTSRESEETQCVYTLRKVHRAALKGAPIDGFSGHQEYSEYCQALLVEAIGRGGKDSVYADDKVHQAFESEVKFVHCGVENFEP